MKSRRPLVAVAVAKAAARRARPKKARGPTSRKRRRVRHRVRNGESLGSIAERYGSTIDAISRRNKLKDADLIYPGQVLRIR